MDEKKLNELLVDRVARRITRRKTARAGAEDPMTRLVAKLSQAGRESAVRAPHDLAARKILIQDLSAIVGKDPKLKQDIVAWAKGKTARKTGQLRDIGGGGGKLGKRGSIDGGGPGLAKGKDPRKGIPR